MLSRFVVALLTVATEAGVGLYMAFNVSISASLAQTLCVWGSE
jgi:hypothetical protein